MHSDRMLAEWQRRESVNRALLIKTVNANMSMMRQQLASPTNYHREFIYNNQGYGFGSPTYHR